MSMHINAYAQDKNLLYRPTIHDVQFEFILIVSAIIFIGFKIIQYHVPPHIYSL